MSAGTSQLSQPGMADKIQTGQTKTEVQAVLGNPASITPLPEGEIWVYTYTQAQAKGASFIPIVGLVAGGSTGSTDNLSVLFNNAGFVNKVSDFQDIQISPLGKTEITNSK